MSFNKKANWAMLLPCLGFLLFYVVPYIASFYYAFTNNAFDTEFVGFKNFADVLYNHVYRMALGNTLVFTVAGVFMLMAFSIFISILFSLAGRAYAALRIAFILPMLLPTAGVSLIWRMVFNPGGQLNFSAQIYTNLWQRLFSPQLIPLYLLFIWKYCGINIIIISSAMADIPEEIGQAASLDGITPFGLYRHIIIPMAAPAFFFSLILSFVNSFRIYKEIFYLFGGEYPPSSVYMLQHFMNNHFQKLNYQLLSAGGIVFLIIICTPVLVFLRRQTRKGDL